MFGFGATYRALFCGMFVRENGSSDVTKPTGTVTILKSPLETIYSVNDGNSGSRKYIRAANISG